ncbi:MAG: PQQ-binding-like beta-propeller repeat protein [Verrucomicrobiota bacterium]|jgi:outer membrane protein assembly factor BamB
MKSNKQWIAPIAASLVLIAGYGSPAQDWPQWRGANRDGKTAAFQVPATWPTNLTQKWKVSVGRGDASPALVGANLYVFARQGTDEVLLCLDPATGATRWQSAYPADYVVTGPPKDHPGPRGTPVVADGKVCTLGVGGILSCFDAATGAVLWRKQSNEDYLGIPYKTDSSMSPIVEQGMCIAHVGRSTNGGVIAFDLASGKPKWKWDGDGPANASPVTMTVGGKRQLVTLSATKLVGLDLADGKLLWQAPSTPASGNNATPVIAGDTVYFTGQGKGGGLSAVRIEAQGGGFEATPLWAVTNKFGARFTTPVLKDGLLYGYTDHLFCADAKTGAQVWDEDAKLGQSASLVDAGPVIFALGGKGQLLVFKPGNTFTQLARISVVNTETWPHPVIAGNRIFVKDVDTLGLWTIE